MDPVTVAPVDKQQQRRLERRFGSGVDQWVLGLPAFVERLAALWGLTFDGDSFPGRTSVVLSCRRADGAAGMLKLSPDPGLISSEARTLALWQGSGRVPEVWAVDEDAGALLMEAVEPGHTVLSRGSLPDLSRIAALISTLHAVELDDHLRAELKPLHVWVGFYFEKWEERRANGPAADVVPASWMHRGQAQARVLATAASQEVLLHGDLHAGNVLEGGQERGLVAVDPRACVGDSSFDAVDWMLWRAESVEEVERRVGGLSAYLDIDSERLLRLCRAVAPIAAVAGFSGSRSSRAEVEAMLALAGG